MNAKTFGIVLLLVALGLGAGWFMTSKQAAEERLTAANTIGSFSNKLVSTESLLAEQKTVNVKLSTNIVERESELLTFSNKWTSVTADLARTEAEAKAAAEKAKADIEQRNARITELEGQKDDLTKKMDGLNVQIGSLGDLIKETERKLAASEGDRELLQKELKRLLAEKADLERKFNDLAVLREQVRKLKEELNIANRLDFIRRGLYGFDKKGAQLLNEGVRSPGPRATNAVGAQINAEVGSDGSAKVSATTNAPAGK